MGTLARVGPMLLHLPEDYGPWPILSLQVPLSCLCSSLSSDSQWELHCPLWLTVGISVGEGVL